MIDLMLTQRLAKAAFAEAGSCYLRVRDTMPNATTKESAVIIASLFGAMRGMSEAFYDGVVSDEPDLIAIFETARVYAVDSWDKYSAK